MMVRCFTTTTKLMTVGKINRTPRPKVVGYFFAWKRSSFLVWGILERKVAEVRKATTPLLLQQGSDFLIRRCKALRQTSRSQESFSLRGQNEGAEVVGRTKLADRTTFKQI